MYAKRWDVFLSFDVQYDVLDAHILVNAMFHLMFQMPMYQQAW